MVEEEEDLELETGEDLVVVVICLVEEEDLVVVGVVVGGEEVDGGEVVGLDEGE